MRDQPDSAEAIHRQALQAYRDGDLAQAEENLRLARSKFLEAEDPLQAAEMGNNLSVILLQLSRPEDARLAVEGTPEIFERASDWLRAAQAHGNLASALEACGRDSQAESHYLRSLDLFRQLEDGEAAALVLQQLSRLRLKQGQPLDALSAMQASLEATPKRGLRNRLLRRMLSLPGRVLPH